MSAPGSMLPGVTGDATTVHAVAEALRRAVNSSNVNGIVACWAPDGIMLPPYHAAVHGRTAIGEYFARVFAARRLTFTFTDSSIDVVGDMAIERLHYTAVATAPSGETTEDVGKGIHIYRRCADGTWQLTQDIWNSDRQPDTASER
jgi:uncharacterized protein (TIGR02246 family)